MALGASAGGLEALEGFIDNLPSDCGMTIRPNTIYIGPADEYVGILGKSLQLLPLTETQAPKYPIDFFFRSLADDKKERAIAIILSRTGTDGTLGLKEIKAGGAWAWRRKSIRPSIPVCPEAP